MTFSKGKNLTFSKYTIFIFFVFFIYVFLGRLIYQYFGHAFIESVYNKESIWLLNHIIEGQDFIPLSYYINLVDNSYMNLIVAFPIGLILLYVVLKPKLVTSWFKGKTEWLENLSEILDTSTKPKIGLWIALAAGLSLFIELMIIRIHSSYFHIFAYFKNVSLLSCFLGLGIGYARGQKKLITISLVLPLLGLQIALLFLLRHTPFGKVLQNPITEQFAMGMDQALQIGNLIIIYSFFAD